MTCIVAYKTKTHIFMGADSIGSNGYSQQVRKDSKVFIKDGKMIIGFTSSFRMGQLIKWKLELPEHKRDVSVEKYMCTDFIDAVTECFAKNGFAEIHDNRESGGTFLVGYKGRIFEVCNDYQVGERIGKASACGSGTQTALGAMHALLKSPYEYDPQYMVATSLKVAGELIVSVGGPYKVLCIPKS